MSLCPSCKVDHRGLCHQCVHSGKVAGRYETSPCAGCTASDGLQQGHGRGMSFDAMSGILAHLPATEPEAPDAMEPAKVVLRSFLGLDPVSREILCYELANPLADLPQTAAHISLTFRKTYTKQAVHHLHGQMRRDPALARVLRGGLQRGHSDAAAE